MKDSELIETISTMRAHCATLALEELVIDAEIAKTVFQLAQGIEVNDNTLAPDVIRNVGHGGNFGREAHSITSGGSFFSLN